MIVMTLDLKPGDEVVRIDRRPGEISVVVRRPNKSLGSVTLLQPVWTHIQEIGFCVGEIILSDPEPGILEGIMSRHPELPLPKGLRQLRVLDHESTKISIVFANEAATAS